MNKNNGSNKKLEREQIIARFGCGFIFGIFIAISTGLVAAPQTMAGLIGIVIVCAIINGLLSVIFGESFWLNFWK